MDDGTKQQQCFSLQLRPGVKVLGGGEEETGATKDDGGKNLKMRTTGKRKKICFFTPIGNENC